MGLARIDCPSQMVQPEHTTQAGSRDERISLNSMVRASSINKRPAREWPAPLNSLSPSAACTAPMMPTNGANTPMVAQATSSKFSSGGNMHA